MAILNLLEFRRDLSAIFPVEGDKNLLRRTRKGALSQTWLRLLASRLEKSLKKREKATKKAGKMGFVGRGIFN